jgi:hypothetical protein
MTILIASAAGLRQHLDRSFLSPIKGAPWRRAQARGIAGFFVIEQEIEGGLPGRAPRESKQRRAAQRPAPPSPTGAGAGASRPSALIVQNPSQTPLSPIRLGISLIRQFNSLLGLKKFPVLSHTEIDP